MQPSRIHHVGLPVSDLDLSFAWSTGGSGDLVVSDVGLLRTSGRGLCLVPCV